MENQEYMRVIEINGIKVEVDLRTAKQINQYKVGDNVKLLIKSGYGNGKYDVVFGVICDFVAFKAQPAIVVAYIQESFLSADLKFVTITSDTDDIEIAPAFEGEVTINKQRVIDRMNAEIEKAKGTALEWENKRNWFINNFEKHFENRGQQEK